MLLQNLVHVPKGIPQLLGVCLKSVFIIVNNPTLNRNISKYNLPNVWD